MSYRAADVLGEIKDPRAIEPLIVALKDKNLLLRTQAAGALAKLGPAVVNPLVVVLQSPGDDVARREVVGILGRIHNPDAIDALIAALKDKDSIVS